MGHDMSETKRMKLQGKVLNIEKTGEKKRDENGNLWGKCIFTVELIGSSKRIPSGIIPHELKGKKVKLARWCCFDWHYELGVRKTLGLDETEAVIKGKSPAQIINLCRG